MKQLTAKEANKLQLEQQVIYVKLIENALLYSFNGKSKLLGVEVSAVQLQQAKNVLKELDRKQQIYDGEKYAKLPYLPSNGNASSTNVPETKVHLDEAANVKFVEAKDGAGVKSVQRKLNSKSHINKHINKKMKHMATKKAAAKKASKKSAKKAKVSNRSYAPKTGTVADVIRKAYGEKLNPNFDKAAFAKKSGIPYHLIYGCITKHEAKLKEGGKKKAKA